MKTTTLIYLALFAWPFALCLILALWHAFITRNRPEQ
jgi:cbb3-type cytochrome oxidase subunit 3